MQTFETKDSYEDAYPEYPFPTLKEFSEEMTHLSVGAEDERPCDVIISFLPGGLAGDQDRVGIVVARAYHGGGRIDVLKTNVSLRAAFSAVLHSNGLVSDVVKRLNS